MTKNEIEYSEGYWMGIGMYRCRVVEGQTITLDGSAGTVTLVPH